MTASNPSFGPAPDPREAPRAFLEHLHQLGYEAADRWITENFDRIGWESTIDLEERFG